VRLDKNETQKGAFLGRKFPKKAPTHLRGRFLGFFLVSLGSGDAQLVLLSAIYIVPRLEQGRGDQRRIKN
jgi:hypothetical protein